MRHRQTLLAALLSVLFAAALHTGPAKAQDALRLGPPVGAAIPHNLAASDQTGKMRSFAELKGENGLLLIFSRSLDW